MRTHVFSSYIVWSPPLHHTHTHTSTHIHVHQAVVWWLLGVADVKKTQVQIMAGLLLPCMGSVVVACNWAISFWAHAL